MEEDDSDSDGIKPSKKMNDADKKYLGKVIPSFRQIELFKDRKNNQKFEHCFIDNASAC